MSEAPRSRVEGLRGARYGEVLLVRERDGRFFAEVYNTLGLNDCPPASFAELDATAIAAEHGAVAALLNGPRRWVLDAIEGRGRDTAPTRKFGTLEMFLAATVELGDALLVPSAYVERRVARDTVFEWAAGTPLHELRAPSGATYVMQALSMALDPSHDLDALGGLGARLSLPDGWTFATRTQPTALRLHGDEAGVATVVQDDLLDTYQRSEHKEEA